MPYPIAAARGRAVAGASRTYYVDATAGNDANVGSLAAPWETIAKVNATTLYAGDQVLFKRGETWAGTKLVVTANGNASQRIVFGAYGTGDAPVISNHGDLGNLTKCVDVKGDYLTFENLKFSDCRYTALYVHDTAYPVGLLVQNCEFTGVGSAAVLYATSARITACNIHDLIITVDDETEDNDYGAVGVWINGGSGIRIDHNTFDTCSAECTDYGYDGGAWEIFVDGSGTLSNVECDHNYVVDCEGVSELASNDGGAASGVYFHDNRVVNSKWLVLLNNTGDFAIDTSDFVIAHNTFVTTSKPTAGEVIKSTAAPASGDMRVVNNLLYVINRDVSAHDEYTHDHNLFWTFDGADITPNYTPAATEIVADPIFADYGGADYSLAATSPAINAGVDLGSRYALDYAGNARGASPDIGCYEFQSAAVAPTKVYTFQACHEAGNLNEWGATSGGVSASADAAMGGSNYGLAVLIENTSADYVYKELSLPSGFMRLRFYIDPNGLTMGDGNTFVILKEAWRNKFYVQMKRDGSDYKLILSAMADDNQWLWTNEQVISDGPHYVELFISRASTDSAADGRVAWWIDGVFKHLQYVDNYDNYPVAAALVFGAVDGIDADTSGTFFLDEFEISSDAYAIGA